MTLTPKNSGWIEVICGSMFSGKTEELIRRIRRAEIAKMNTIIFKPNIDNKETFAIKHGDRLIPIISAASISAKVTRDRIMIEIDKEFPESKVNEISRSTSLPAECTES